VQDQPLVQWLIGHLPEGGTTYRSPGWDCEDTSPLLGRFFDSVAALPFNRFDHRDLSLELLDTGTGDPLRWSAARIEQALTGLPFYDDHTPLASVLDVPDPLRAFIPFAHAQSGIRQELTSLALVAIDQMGPDFRREALRKAKYWDFEDEAS
jgi:hypothetical protein